MERDRENQRNVDATVYVGNLDERVTEDLLWELFLQMGPLVSVFMPPPRDGKSQGFGFVEFRGEDDAEYAIKVMNMVSLYDKTIKVNKVHSDPSESMSLDVGAKVRLSLFLSSLLYYYHHHCDDGYTHTIAFFASIYSYTYHPPSPSLSFTIPISTSPLSLLLAIYR